MPARRSRSPAQVTLEMSPGFGIQTCISEAVRLSGVLGCGTRFTVNGVTVLTDTDTDEPKLYERVMELMDKPPPRFASAWKPKQ